MLGIWSPVVVSPQQAMELQGTSWPAFTGLCPEDNHGYSALPIVSPRSGGLGTD